MSHTPGPWTTSGWYSDQGITADRTVCEIYLLPRDARLTQTTVAKVYREPVGNGGGNGESNARLIAAAPDLLKIAESIMYSLNGANATKRSTNSDYANSTVCHLINDLVRDARAAIDKATGK